MRKGQWLGIMALLVLAGCRQAGAPEALPVIDLSKDYPEKEFVAQDLFDVEYRPDARSGKYNLV